MAVELFFRGVLLPRLFNIEFLYSSCLSFSLMRFVSVSMVHPWGSIDITTAWKKSRFILSNRSDFHMIDGILIAVHFFVRYILTSLSVDETLLPRYVNLSTNFRGPPFRVEMAFSQLKHICSVLFAFMWRLMPLTPCSRLCSEDSAWVSVFARNAMASALSASNYSFGGI